MAKKDLGQIVPDFSIGTVNTVEETVPANVTLAGTGENIIMNFDIPKGKNGVDAISPLIETQGTKLIIKADTIDYTGGE